MLRRILALACLLVLTGCCCRPCPCPCPPRPPPPTGPPPEPPPGGGDFKCATWATDDCDPGSTGVQPRPWLLDQIELRLNAATGIDPALKSQIQNRINKHRADKNCKSNTNSTPDCAPMNQPNGGCLLEAFNLSTLSDWAQVSTKLAQGH